MTLKGFHIFFKKLKNARADARPCQVWNHCSDWSGNSQTASYWSVCIGFLARFAAVLASGPKPWMNPRLFPLSKTGRRRRPLPDFQQGFFSFFFSMWTIFKVIQTSAGQRVLQIPKRRGVSCCTHKVQKFRGWPDFARMIFCAVILSSKTQSYLKFSSGSSWIFLWIEFNKSNSPASKIYWAAIPSATTIATKRKEVLTSPHMRTRAVWT